MPLYHYLSITAQGKKSRGKIEALSQNDAKERLRTQGIYLLSLTTQNKSSWNPLKKRGRISKEALSALIGQLAQLLSAKVPLYECLLSLQEQYRQEEYHAILLSLCEQIKAGARLSEAMQLFPESFSPMLIALVAAGENSGSLESTLSYLAQHLSQERKLKKQILTALLYPLILAGFSLIVVFVLLTFVLPSITALFEGREVNSFTQTILTMSHILTHYWGLYLPLLLLSIVTLLYFLRRPQGKEWIAKQMLTLPLLKTLIIHIAVARFCRTLGTLLKGGVNMIEALRISKSVMQNPILEQIIHTATEQIIGGSTLAYQLSLSQRLPPLVIRCIAIGEESGALPQMLGNLSSLYEEEVERSLTRVTALAQPVILIFMGAVIGLIMLAVLLPLTDATAFLQ